MNINSDQKRVYTQDVVAIGNSDTPPKNLSIIAHDLTKFPDKTNIISLQDIAIALTGNNGWGYFRLFLTQVYITVPVDN